MSYVKLPAYIIIQRCEDCINKIHATRERDLQKYIDELMEEQEKQQKSWWGRFIHGKPLTREELLESVKSKSADKYNFFSQYDFIQLHGTKGVAIAERLLHAARISTHVYVDTQDLEWI